MKNPLEQILGQDFDENDDGFTWRKMLLWMDKKSDQFRLDVARNIVAHNFLSDNDPNFVRAIQWRDHATVSQRLKEYGRAIAEVLKKEDVNPPIQTPPTGQCCEPDHPN
jgi:hypothetical protein